MLARCQFGQNRSQNATSGWEFTYTGDLTADSATLDTTYTWGLDLSGSLQGAGGVGGLVAIHEQAGNGSAKAGQVIYPAYDGNGNIIRLFNSGGGTIASYAYDGFGSRLNSAASDIDDTDYAEEQEFGFSTKFRDPETGLLYYGYRYYDPVTGRWPSRDPIGERGGLNIYIFLSNNPIGATDYLGLDLNLISPNTTGKQARDQTAAKMAILQNNLGAGKNEVEVHAHGDCCGAYDDRKALPKWEDYQREGAHNKAVVDDVGRVRLDAKGLADLIEREGGWKPGMRVKLVICNAGTNHPEIDENLAEALAQELANRGKMEQEVVAPNGKTIVEKDTPFEAKVLPPGADGRDPAFRSTSRKPKSAQ